MVESPLHDVESLSVTTEELFKQPAWSAFFNKVAGTVKESARPHLLSVTIQVSPFEPLDIIQNETSTGFRFYWEKPDHNIGLCGGESLLKLTAEGPSRFEQLSRMIQTWQNRSFTYPDDLPDQPLFVGGFSFFDEFQDDRWSDFHNGFFTVPAWLYFRKGDKGFTTINLLVTSASQRNEIEHQITLRLRQFFNNLENDQEATDSYQLSLSNPVIADQPELWKAKVGEITEKIKAGEFEKVVLARSLRIKTNEQPDPAELLQSLKEKYPNCYQFWIQPGKGKSFFGSTPERLAAFHNGHIVTESLAGSISRDADEKRDADLATQLSSSEKDLLEHRFVVDAITERLKKFTVQLYAPDEPRILRYPNVQHLYTPITGQMKDGVNPLELISNLHPTPAVGGLPRESALNLIRRLESFERGWYAGPVGWLDRSGNGEFSVAIRSALLEDNNAEIYAGCGVVADSDPQAEWEETELKLIPLLTAFQAV